MARYHSHPVWRHSLRTLIKGKLVADLKLLVLLAALLTGLTSNANAQIADHTKPINVKADTSIFDERSGTQTLTGNVEVTQGSLSIAADKIVIQIKDGALYEIRGTGSPIIFQQLTLDNQLVRGECNEITYNTVTTEITFRGNANFERPGQQLSGDTIEYNLRELTFKAAGNNEGRVNITLQPSQLRP